MTYLAKKRIKLWWLFFVCALVIFIPAAIFIAIETASLSADGYSLINILSGTLSADLNTSQGSSYNAIQGIIKLASPLVVIFFLLAALCFFLEKRKSTVY